MGRFADLVGSMSHYPIVLVLALGVCALLVVAHRRSQPAGCGAGWPRPRRAGPVRGVLRPDVGAGGAAPARGRALAGGAAMAVRARRRRGVCRRRRSCHRTLDGAQLRAVRRCRPGAGHRGPAACRAHRLQQPERGRAAGRAVLLAARHRRSVEPGAADRDAAQVRRLSRRQPAAGRRAPLRHDPYGEGPRQRQRGPELVSSPNLRPCGPARPCSVEPAPDPAGPARHRRPARAVGMARRCRSCCDASGPTAARGHSCWSPVRSSASRWCRPC